MKVLPLLALAFLPALGPVGARAQAQGVDAVATYQARGVLRSFDPATHQATISHDAIPGYMQAMTMAFDTRSPQELGGLRPGDILSFRLCVTARAAWIDHIVKTGVSAAPLLDLPSAAATRELVAGEIAPDVRLTDQSGKVIHLRDFKGRAVAITFIYTGCPLPTYCPLITQNFSEVQSLMTRIGAGDGWQLLSISMDPAHDTPQVLAAFAAAYHADPAHWVFATGDEGTVQSFGAAFGLEFRRSGGQISHNLRTIVVDPAGRIHSIYSGNSWTPQQLVSDLRAAMRHAGVR